MCNPDLSEDLSQEVTLTVYQKAWQLRDRTQFRAWVFTIARHALCRRQWKHSPGGEIGLESHSSSTEKTSVVLRITDLSTMFCSSRMLPGQS